MDQEVLLEREIPSFRMRAYKVVRLIPKRAAAPFGPMITPRVCCSVLQRPAKMGTNASARTFVIRLSSRTHPLLFDVCTCGHTFGSSRPLIQDEISCKRLLFSSRRVVQQRGDLCCVSLFIRLFLIHS